MPSTAPQPNSRIDLGKDAVLVTVAHKTEPGRTLLFNLDRSAAATFPVSKPRIYNSFDLLSLLSRTATEWGFERPGFSMPDGTPVVNISQVKKARVVFAENLSQADYDARVLEEPQGPTPYPVVGNIPDLLPAPFIAAFELAGKYGSFFPMVREIGKKFECGGN